MQTADVWLFDHADLFVLRIQVIQAEVVWFYPHVQISDTMLPKPLPLTSRCAFFILKDMAMSAQASFMAPHLLTDTPPEISHQ